VESVVDAYPLNATHRGILFHSLQCEVTDVYLSVISLRIQGALDTALLLQAWQQAFAHHPSLRSGVVVDGVAEPLWVVHESIEPDWEYLDFTSLAPEECEKQEQAAVKKLSQTQFTFAAEALMKFTLITLNDNTHRLLWAVHHLLSDGWSTSIVLEDVSSAYAASVQGVTPTLPPALEYGRFIDSQSKLPLDPLKQYWSEYLTGRTPTAIKLREVLRDNWQCDQGAIETRTHLDEKLSQAIADAARRFKTTSRGVGLYASTVPVIVDTADPGSLEDWFSGIGTTLLTHAAYDALALADIQKLVSREANETLFSSVVALAGHESDLCFGTTENNGVKIDSVDYQIHSHFDISLLIKPGDQTSLNLITQTDKLDASANDAIVKRYIAVLNWLVDASCTSLPELRQRCSQFAQQMLDTNLSAAPESHQRIDDWILDVASQHPTSVAVVQGDKRLTYAELVQNARQVSLGLHTKVEGNDRAIGICLADRVTFTSTLFAA